MSTSIISKNIIQKGNTVILPRKEYERLLEAAEEKNDLRELQRTQKGKTSFRELNECLRARV